MSRRREEKENENKASLPELFFFVIIIACVYFILALFGSSLTGEGGQKLGNYLRTSWGGPVIVLILFAMYLAFAKLMKFRVPRIRRQFFGTLTLYFSFAFLLGLLKESGWTSEWTLLTAGNFGSGIASFFVLNAGTFVTLILVTGSFILSAVFFGSKILKASLPRIPKLIKFKPRRKTRKRVRESEPSPKKEVRQESPKFIPEPAASTKKVEGEITFQMPKLRPAPEDEPKKTSVRIEKAETEDIEKRTATVMSNAVEMIDNALALIDSGELKAPVQKTQKSVQRSKKPRRPLPAVSITPALPDETAADEKSSSSSSLLYDESAFPPPPELFGAKIRNEPDREILKYSEKQAKSITSALKTFGVSASVAHIVTGPSFIQYQLELSPGTKVNKITGLSEDLAMSLEVLSVRIEAPIPGTRYVGIEVPCSERKIISLRNIVESEDFRISPARLPIPLGVTVDGKISVVGLEEMPHVLVAGNKGSGRSMFVNACILSMCSRQKPENLRLILIDPRHVEFAVYDGLPHLLSSPVTDPDSAVKALMWAYDEMEKRTAAFAAARVRNLASFNRKQKNSGGGGLPEIVIVINELADLLYSSGTEIEGVIMRLAQKAGASGIYMILSAQRPSPDVFTTMIKTNIPARAAFSLSSESESKNIIGTGDAVKLTGKGDMLFRDAGAKNPQPVRYQTAFISEDKISEFVEYMFSNLEPPETMKF
ncbi:MAG: hypothetical protein IJQ74_04280 [Synergistaceae bacterium]|nr:hypothetical protein [Synergistaceae bacterium]